MTEIAANFIDRKWLSILLTYWRSSFRSVSSGRHHSVVIILTYDILAPISIKFLASLTICYNSWVFSFYHVMLVQAEPEGERLTSVYDYKLLNAWLSHPVKRFKAIMDFEFRSFYAHRISTEKNVIKKSEMQVFCGPFRICFLIILIFFL